VLLVSIIFPILITSEWKQRLGLRGMHGLFLVLQSALLGAVCAQDLFLMFFFWMLSVLPFYFLIGIWGGSGRESAAFRSIVSASIGNALLFAALVLVYYSVDPHSFSLRELGGGKLIAKTFNFVGVELPVSPVAFGLVCAGLCLRAPIWPFHGWFTKASEEAPASVFIALSAVSVPISIGLFMRLAYSLFPDTVAQAADGIVIVGGINLVMGGICALYQRDLRLLLAFVCLGSVGLVLIGVGSLNSIGVVGSVFQQLLVGLGLAGFGLFTKVMIDRTGSAVFVNSDGAPGFGGVSSKAPAVALVAGVMVASLLGFPGLGGFVGQALVIIGSYTIHPAVVLLTGCALVLATYYLFTMYRHVFLGRPGPDISSFYDLTLRERAYLIPLVCTLVVFGVYPKPLIELVRPTILILLSTIK
jgi:NADH-quinone oxidoreductase subunit M